VVRKPAAMMLQWGKKAQQISYALLKNSIEISIRFYFSILYYLSKNGW
jgi:hypothetical protein